MVVNGYVTFIVRKKIQVTWGRKCATVPRGPQFAVGLYFPDPLEPGLPCSDAFLLVYWPFNSLKWMSAINRHFPKLKEGNENNE